VQPGVPEQNVEKTRSLLSEFAALIPSGTADVKNDEKLGSGPWLWGQEHPTALDAHLIVFVARLQDIGLGELVPRALEKLVQRACAGDEWQTVMQGRRTMQGL
jgi:hypothetical protein